MAKNLVLWLCLGGFILIGWSPLLAGDEDAYLWLENVTGEKALKWVEEHNQVSKSLLEATPGYKNSLETALKILDSKERIPYVHQYGKYLYNFWRDAQHIRGIYRRTSLEEYRKDNPTWEAVLDLDKLASDEKENWVYKGATMLLPTFDRCLFELSRGGADAVVVREFDLIKKEFVKDGFQLPEARTTAMWRDKDCLFVATDFGEGSLTPSGYPRIVKTWKRGTNLAEAETLYKAEQSHVYAYAMRFYQNEKTYDLLSDAATFYDHAYFILKDGKPVQIDIPKDASFEGPIHNQFLVHLKSDWKPAGTLFPQGALIAQDVDATLKGEKNYQILFNPKNGLSIESTHITQNKVILNVLDHVASRIVIMSWDATDGWTQQNLPIEPNGNAYIFETQYNTDDFYLLYQSFLVPSSLFRYDGKTGKMEKMKNLPAFFDASPMTVEQWEATSKDGTQIPYFVIHRKDWKLDGTNPTLLFGYGGFEISLTPHYSAILGQLWLEKGGAYIYSNIRGGGEFGPQWHQAALLKNRHKAFEDFIGIAEDLIKRKVTKPVKLGIQGGSNGGLLVGAVTMMRPELFNAVVCQVPLLDMKRYTKLLAGASWAGEYGNPDDPDMWNYIRTYSPYQNVKKEAKYPEIFFTTSTRDDRVHPGHARKMVAKMEGQGHHVLYYENTEGGHAGAANNEQSATMIALEYTYLYKKLMTDKN